MFTKSILKAMFNQGSRIRVSFLILVLLFTLTGFHPVQAAGLIYYVDKTNPSCSDSGTGRTTALPFCTIGKGAKMAGAGDKVRVLAGSYAETITVPNSGSAGNPITFSAVPGVTVTGNGLSAFSSSAFRMIGKSYIVVDGFTITNTLSYGIFVSGSTAITISHNHVTHSGLPASGSVRAGIFFDSTNNSIITRNTTDHNSQDGITLRNGSSNNTVSNNVSFANAEQWQRNAAGIHVNGAASAQNTIIHNIVYANEDTGIQFYNGAHNNIVVGNLSYGNGDHGIDNSNSTNNIVVGNTVQGNYTDGINFEGTAAPGSSGAKIIGNISVDNGINPSTGVKSNIRVDVFSIANIGMDYNLVYLSGPGTVIHWNGINYATLAAFHTVVPGQEVHGIQANPLFVSPVPYASTQPPAVVVGNYHIQAGSPAIDSANSNAPYEPLTDIDGSPRVDDLSVANTGAGVRAYDDRGAYEFHLTIRGNAGLGGVTLSYTGGSPVKAAADGSYLITVPYNWSGTITPSMMNYGFTPAFRTYTNLKVNLTGQSFTAAYSVPTLVAPTGTISDTTPTYTFTKISIATQYQYQLFKGTTLIYTQTVLATACGTTANCVHTPATVLADGAYNWKARAMVDGVWRAYSAAKTFTIITVPTPVAPTGTISDTTPTYTFTKISGATQYQYQLFKGASLVYTQSVLTTACGITANCVHTPATVLTDGAYTWKVRAMIDSVWKTFSAAKAFSIITVPTLVAPTGTISDTTPTFTFTKISRATQYQYQLFKGTSLIYTQSVLTTACGTTANCVHTPATVLTDGAYTWKARAMVDGVWKAFSPSKAFSIITVPTLIAPTGTISDKTPTYTFTKISRATQYQYQLFNGTTLVYTQSVLASACGTTANCLHTPATWLANGVYTWKARAMVDGIWKAFSPVKTFTLN